MSSAALSARDLTSYFERIGYNGPREPSLAALRGIVAAHVTTIPFENIDVLLGRGVRLDTASLMAKLVHGGRGGYCFEHNTLLQQALTSLGFEIEGYSARVLWGRPADDPGPRSHMLLRVSVPEGDFLADVGFGGLTLTAPLRLATGFEQETPHEPVRLVSVKGEIELHVRLDDAWTKLYRIAPVPQLPIDYEASNWFTATHPKSLFTNNLLAARPEPDRRYALINRDATVRHRDGRVERRGLADAAELAEVLTNCFRVAPSAADRDADALWERLPR